VFDEEDDVEAELDRIRTDDDIESELDVIRAEVTGEPASRDTGADEAGDGPSATMDASGDGDSGTAGDTGTADDTSTADDTASTEIEKSEAETDESTQNDDR
jgi:hypothetical protein